LGERARGSASSKVSREVEEGDETKGYGDEMEWRWRIWSGGGETVYGPVIVGRSVERGRRFVAVAVVMRRGEEVGIRIRIWLLGAAARGSEVDGWIRFRHEAVGRVVRVVRRRWGVDGERAKGETRGPWGGED
jgi:hypothetical protein